MYGCQSPLREAGGGGGEGSTGGRGVVGVGSALLFRSFSKLVVDFPCDVGVHLFSGAVNDTYTLRTPEKASFLSLCTPPLRPTVHVQWPLELCLW